jgi:hypothetical protein
MQLLKFSVWASTVLLTMLVVGSSQLAVAQNDTSSISPRDFWASLTLSERKLPRDILAQHYLAEGKPVPASWEQAARARSEDRVNATLEQTFRLDGDSVEALEAVLSQIGAEAIARSGSRGYVTAQLTIDQVVKASNFAEVRKIRHVKGPTAQGVTEAWTAHRVADLSGAGKPSTISSKPAITGDEVVIGLISLPYKSSDLAALDALSTRVVPLPTKISEITGVTDPAGSTDLLNMLQVIYDIAPGARVVVGSPGTNGTPAQMRALIDKLVAGSGSVGSAGYIPPANIIVDDLDFLSQNPFEVDEVSEAIVAARAAGVLYVTAAGDGGHHESVNSSSNVYVADFNGQKPPDTEDIFDYVAGNLHMFEGNQPSLIVSQPLADLCLFWSEAPDNANIFDDLTLWTFGDLNDNGMIDADEALDFFALVRPGGCLSEEGLAGPLPAKTKLILEDFSRSFEDRFLIVGERENTALDPITGAFELSTQGAIRGHAYHPAALTVGTTPYIGASDAVSKFSEVEAGDLTVSDYSADGEPKTQERFYWQNVGTSTADWQAVASGEGAAAKPDLTATSNLSIKNTDGAEESFHGTSASAAVTAGIAALYWEFRQWQLDDRKVEGGEVSSEDIRSIMRDSVIDGGVAGWDSQFGQGVLDAPRALEIPLPTIATTLSVVPQDAESVSVSWLIDYLAEGTVATSTLNCLQNGTPLVTNKPYTGSGSVTVNASDTSPVECTLSTAFTVGSGAYSNSATPLTGSATPEALNTGLPVWLLYIATQPQSAVDS